MKLSTVGTFFVLVRVLHVCVGARMQCVHGRESGRVSES